MRHFITLVLLISTHALNAQGTQDPLLGETGGIDECHNVCTALLEAFGDKKVFYGVLPEGFRESYFSARQSEVTPACVLQPTSPQDVSTAVQIINQRSCHFAIKSGGHAMFAGASNAIGGITIDLKNLNGIKLSEDRATAGIGPGLRWGEVYKTLEPQGITVVGGRVSDVGVGGFMLGGGISFLSRFHGWASDNVRNYEVVLANGSISNINYESHPDLFWALRGGGSNFGIVTRFDLETYPQTLVWGGTSVYTFSDVAEKLGRLVITNYFTKLHITQTIGRLAIRFACLIGRCTTTDEFLEAFVKMAKKGEQEDDIPYMHLYLSFAYIPRFDWLGGSTCMIHSEPVANPPAFRDLIESSPPTINGGRIRNLTHLMAEIDPYNPSGFRTMYAQMTFRADKVFLSKVLDIFIEAVVPINHVSGIFSGFVLQPITQIARANRHKKGGNPFGIKEEDGSLVSLSIFPQWDNAEDDAKVQDAFTDFMNRIAALSKEMGVFHPWIYQNYANISQDVFGSFGQENRKRLRQIQGKYDSERIFAKLQPGYYKL